MPTPAKIAMSTATFPSPPRDISDGCDLRGEDDFVVICSAPKTRRPKQPSQAVDTLRPAPSPVRDVVRAGAPVTAVTDHGAAPTGLRSLVNAPVSTPGAAQVVTRCYDPIRVHGEKNRLNPSDVEILQRATSGLALQIAMARLAAGRSTHAEVIALAQDILHLSERGQGELVRWARDEGAALSVRVAQSDESKVENLRPRRSHDFDDVYLRTQEQRLQAAIVEAQAAQQSALDPRVRAFAERSVPEIKQLLAKVQNTPHG
jgi:putative membrane protein